MAWYSGVSDASCPRPLGLSGTYFTEPPTAVHWPLRSGYLASSWAAAFAIPIATAAANVTTPTKLQRRIVALPAIPAEGAANLNPVRTATITVEHPAPWNGSSPYAYAPVISASCIGFLVLKLLRC